MTTAYLAAEGFADELDAELARAGVTVALRHGLLRVSESAPIAAAWAANQWTDAERIEVASISDAARQLRRRQRNWALYAPAHRGRARLIAEQLPAVSGRPLRLGELAPTAPLGSCTLLERDLLLAATNCASPFPHGVARFVEDREGPPSRAYLKLWEAFARIGRQPTAAQRCLDLGAAPGGWTWLLARTGAAVTAVDRAPLAPQVAQLANVTTRRASAFALDPTSVGPVDWWCSDLVAYPRRLFALVTRWLATGLVANLVCTVKFQGATDHAAAEAFAALPGARLMHLSQNKHELTCIILDARR